MNVFTDISQVTEDKNTVVTIGTFDGFHLGHKEIVNRALMSASKQGGRNFLVTFEPHPRSVVSRDFDLKLLTTLDEKLKLFEEAGIENVLVINFTPELSKLTSDEFFERYISKIGLNELVIGYDHRLGRNRDGDENKLREIGLRYSFDVTIVHAVTIDGDTVSSTKVRQAILDGNIEKANKYLGRNYSFKGTVVKGAMRGRTLGFPTANIASAGKEKLLPARGVYVVEIVVSGSPKHGVMNIGMRPTFGDTPELITEINIFNMSEDIYGESVEVSVLQKLRPERKFSSREELIRQIEEDKKTALNFINNLNN
ncbi:MAG: bifunctional riboflavin kinase/FAD synthetase [Bacteroidota bacterium]|jgi:riboflavin kinase/FMN adenylyltransferase|nr:bifunctional riboflavin kinase/FAD synthetase [Ignavibacteria bacterium]MCU7512559.1 bifunctional riboflavin kinase/FAD synthetase [Ignavibacteria bacterium]